MSQGLPRQDQIAPVSFHRFESDFEGFAQALGDSYARWGFAVVSDHSLAQDRLDAALDQMKAFFALSEAAKLKYRLPVQGQRGYTPFGVETAKGHVHYDLKEFWHVGRGGAGGWTTGLAARRRHSYYGRSHTTTRSWLSRATRPREKAPPWIASSKSSPSPLSLVRRW